MDISVPHALVALFEQASNEAQVATTRSAAEQTLSTLSSRSDSISLALLVLQSTTSSVARFYAAATLRKAARERWHTIPHQHRFGSTSHRHFLVNLVISRPNFLQFERVAILRTAAHLTHQAYLEEPNDLRNDFYSFLSATVSSHQTPPHALLVTIELMDLILDEFCSPSTTPTTSLNFLECESFIMCRNVFASPQGHILLFFQSTLQMLQNLLAIAPVSSFESPAFFSRAVPALSIIHRIITTDFYADPIATADRQTADPLSSASSSDILEAVVINKFNSPEWLPFVRLIPFVLNVSLSITSGLILSSTTSSDSSLLGCALNTVTAVAAISHNSYTLEPSSQTILAAIMEGTCNMRWSTSSLRPVRLAYAEVWRRVSCAHGVTNVTQLSSNYISTFTVDTCNQLDATARHMFDSPYSDSDLFSLDIIDLLMETWANLALQADDGSALANNPLSISVEQVVVHFIRVFLRTSGEFSSQSRDPLPDLEEDLGFDDSSLDDSRISVAAILTRFVLDKTVPALAQSLLQVCEKVVRWPRGETTADGLPLDLYQEDLYFLIQLCSAVLTDEAKGEYPSVPTQFLPFPIIVGTMNNQRTIPAYAQQLISALLKVAEEESRLVQERSVHCNEASPRIGSAILDSLSRIMQTYLAPLNTSHVAITFDIAGGLRTVSHARNVCFKKCMEGLTMRGFESDVAESAGRLLATIATASNHFPELKDSAIWEGILQSGVQAFEALPPSTVQNVGKSLVTVLGDSVAERMIIPAINSLDALTENKSHWVNGSDRVVTIINLLRGAARSNVSGEYTRRALLQSLKVPDGTAARCVRSFGSLRPDVSRTLLRLADEVIYSSMPFLDDKDCRDLMSNVIALIEMHVGIIRMCSDDVCNDVEEMLLVLTHILDEEVEVNVGEACFHGLSTILSLLNQAMLDIPTVNKIYFSFVAQLVSAHADRLYQLPEDFCSKILQSINVQRLSYDPSSERKALEAISALARSQLSKDHQCSKGVSEIPFDSDWNRSGKGSNFRSCELINRELQEFAYRIFEVITNGGAHITNLDAAADALLPLLHIRYKDEAGQMVSVLEKAEFALMKSLRNNKILHEAFIRLGRAANEAGVVHGFHVHNGEMSQQDSHDGSQERSVLLQASRKFREAVAQFSLEARNCVSDGSP